MHEEPDLSAGSISAALEFHWAITARSIEYAPVGFGSYHWIATQPNGRRWFITADRVGAEAGDSRESPDPYGNLHAAYSTAAALRSGGLSFVVAPVPDKSRQIVRRLEPEWAMAVFEYIEGEPSGKGPWSTAAACAKAARLVGQLHASEPPGTLRPFDFAVAYRGELFDDLSGPWVSGPYGERARRLLISSYGGVQALLAQYDRLVEEVNQDVSPWVVTHGEPHSANFIQTADGGLYLIDWDTVRLAPPERDLASLLIEEDAVLSAYRSGGGPRPPRPAAVQLFRVWWDVGEICGFIRHFRGSHGDSRDDQTAWHALERYLDVDSNWPNLKS